MTYADISQSIHEQHLGVFCSCLGHLFSWLDMAFLGRGTSFGHCLHHNGDSRKSQIKVSHLDIVRCIPSLSSIPIPCFLRG